MTFALTQKGIRAVAQVKSKYEYLKTEYKTNAFDRVVFEMGNMPACVICYAIAKPSSDDFSDMVRQGYATRRLSKSQPRVRGYRLSKQPHKETAMTTTKIVWNGCDNYVEADQAASRGHQFDGETLFHGEQAFRAFDAVEIDLAGLPKDEDGEPIVDGVLGSESGKFYRAS